MDIAKEPETPEVGDVDGSGALLAEAEGDCEESGGVSGVSSAFCPPGDSALTPTAIAITANVPPPTTVRLVVLIEFETVPLPDSCLRFSRRSRFASLRACCDIGHQTLTDG